MKKEVNSLGKKIYITPDIVIVNIETEQNILASGSGEGVLPGMPGGPW